jgi:hypothetical protein
MADAERPPRAPPRPVPERASERAAILRWTAGLGAITAGALTLRTDIPPPSARARLGAAERAGLLRGHRLLAGAPTLYTLTAAGQRACGSPRGPSRVSASGARHLAVCAHVAAGLARCYPDHEILGEPELRHRERGGDVGASVELGRPHAGAVRRHRPDLLLLPPGHRRQPLAVEVELTVKAPGRLSAICRAWARSRAVGGVLYLAPEPVRGALRRAVAAAQGAERIAVVGLEAVPGLDAAGMVLPGAPAQRPIPSAPAQRSIPSAPVQRSIPSAP